MFKSRNALIIGILTLFLGVYAFSQTPAGGSAGADGVLSRIQAGVNLYGQSKWGEAATELRSALEGTSVKAHRSEALFWLSLSEMALEDYEGAVRDMDEMETTDPENWRIGEMLYHKGRVLFFLGRFDEAILLLKGYADSIPETGNISPQDASRKSSALYWVGECLYSMGLLDRAVEVFLYITEIYPQSVKYEAAIYRLALINQKKVEAELLSLLKWSHEESLKTMEEYERRERSYDQALIAYQKRIAEMLKDTRLADLENSNARYREQLAMAEERIRVLEDNLNLAHRTSSASQPVEKLGNLKSTAVELREQLIKELKK
jgi:tetratricopeptide (TPR) repeat protein